jgi:uncharacterized DUF497 family protein
MVIFDKNKARANLRKHGLLLAESEAALRDLACVTVEDWSEGERRFNTIGSDAYGRILMVTWTERGRDLRIISARKATANERRTYHGTRD